MKSADIIRMLTKDGWYKVNQVGSHVKFHHPTKPGHVVVPHPKRDLPIGTVKSIMRQAGIE